MLTHLHIQNYALIDYLDIDFKSGFSVITGETGAGKSIILGAIGLLLGQRADSKTIKNEEKRCIIEAEFDLKGHHLESFFHENDLDYDTLCIIRRELSATGKSRAFINDTPASVSQLKELGDQLIDIHSQHQNLLLGKENFQLHALDTLAENEDMLTHYQQTFKEFRTQVKKLEELKKATTDDKNELDYIQFQYSQLKDAKLQPQEQEELEALQQTLEHAEDIKSSLYRSGDQLQNEEGGITSLLHEVQRQLNNISSVFSKAEELSQRIDSCYIELKDIANEIENNAEEIEYDPERLEQINERLNTIYSLQQKHHVDNIQSLIDIQETLGEKLNHIENRDEEIAELQQCIDTISIKLQELADQLTATRKNVSTALQQQMCIYLQSLGMPNVRFEVNITQLEEATITGKDKVQFLFSANKSSAMLPISQVASGGEIARVMLSLKAILCQYTMLPTIIFDEIDTGVSGQIAESMALIMQKMGEKPQRQVISITHLPQIAALGSQHYRVFKNDTTDGTATHIAQLTNEDRIEEIAHMLSGATITSAAIENARALLSQHPQS